MKGSTCLVEVAVLELELQELKQLVHLDPPRMLMEDLEDRIKELVVVHLGIISPKLLGE